MSLKLVSKIYAISVVVLISILIGISFWVDQLAQTSTERHLRKTDLQLKEERLSHALIDRETGFRGYLLTLDEDFLLPYNESVDEVERLLSELKLLIPADEWNLLNDLVEQRTSFYQEGIALAARVKKSKSLELEGSYEKAIKLVRSGEGKDYTRDLREIIDAAIMRAELIAATAEVNQKRFEKFVRLINYITYSLLAILAVLPLWFVHRFLISPIDELKRLLNQLIINRKQVIQTHPQAPAELTDLTEQVVTATDELLDYEDKLSEKVIELDKKQKQQDKLYGVVGHELVTPASSAKMLVDKACTEIKNDDLDAASKELNTLLGSIRNLSLITESSSVIANVANELSNSGVSQSQASFFENMKILLVEDTPTLRLMGKMMLEKVGANVVIAEDGDDALSALSSFSPDVVLTDILMPNMDGYQLTQRLRNQGYTLPIVGITGSTVGSEAQQLLDSGADKVLAKPLALSDLESALRSRK